MEGIFIYWICWMFWVIVHFFLEKNMKHSLWSALLLVFIALLTLMSDYSIGMFSSAFLLLFIILCAVIREYSFLKMVRHLFITWTIATAYGGFQLIILFDPVITMFDERWVSSILICLLATVMTEMRYSRLHLALCGLSVGEVLTVIAKVKLFYASEPVGQLIFFDKVAIISLLFCIYFYLHSLSLKLSYKLTVEQYENQSTLIKQFGKQ